MKINEFIINSDNTILDALERLDRVAQKVLFTTEEGRLQAAITDGDIRRWILKKGNLDAPVRCAANYSPKYLINLLCHHCHRVLRDAVPGAHYDAPAHEPGGSPCV